MPSYILKCQPDRDLYVLWSEVVDAPTAVGSRAALEQQLAGADSAADRFDRADAAGTSSKDGYHLGWHDDGMVYQGHDWLPRAKLTAAAERLLADNNADLRDLCEPIEEM